MKVVLENPRKVLKYDLLVLEIFGVDNRRLIIQTFRQVTVNSCIVVVFSIDYLLQIKVDHFAKQWLHVD